MSNSKIYSRFFGKGNPVIFLHGIFGSYSQWIPFVNDFNGFQLIFPDLPNHGRSIHIPSINYNDISQILYEWISSLNIHHIIIAGHSFGGRIAVKLACDHPGLFKKLILIDSSTEKIELSSDIKLWINSMNEVSLEKFSSYTDIKEFFKGKNIPENETNLLLKNFKREGKNFFWKSNINVLTKNIQSITQEIEITDLLEMPACIIRGGLSDHVTADTVRKMKKKIPLLKDMIIADAGHWIHVDAREKFVSFIQSFLNE